MSSEVLDEKVVKDPACRPDMVKSHPTSARRIVHTIKLRPVGLDCRSSEIPALETDEGEKVLDGGDALEALSGWKQEGFAFCK